MANERLSDEAIQFRAKARRRLIGAVILSLAAVVILPWALESHPPTASSGLAVYLYPDKPNKADVTGVMSPATTTVAGSVASPAPGLAAQYPEADSASIRKTKNNPVLAKSFVQSGKATGEVAKKAATTQIKSKLDIATSQGPLPESYAVQLGLFSDPDNAKKISAKVALLGFKGDLKKVHLPSGNAIRVRIGPFVTKTQAEQAISKLEKNNIKGVLVANNES